MQGDYDFVLVIGRHKKRAHGKLKIVIRLRLRITIELECLNLGCIQPLPSNQIHQDV